MIYDEEITLGKDLVWDDIKYLLENGFYITTQDDYDGVFFEDVDGTITIVDCDRDIIKKIPKEIFAKNNHGYKYMAVGLSKEGLVFFVENNLR